MTAMTAEQLRDALDRVADKIISDGGSAQLLRIQISEEIREIAARLSGMAAGWQPIETAPKDGQDYIASDGRLRTLENQPKGCMPGRWSKGPDGKWSGYANRPIGYAPKYWHPLPAAPEPPHA